jgi:hypothetical protein
MVSIEKRIILSIRRINWILFCVALSISLLAAPADFTWGIFCGGLIVTLNFQMLARTLKKSLSPPFIAPHHIILAKYYLRFILSGVIIFFLIRQHVVNPLGLIIGLSVVVASIMLTTVMEIKRLIFKEAV